MSGFEKHRVDILAAGGIVSRRQKDKLQVLLIYRSTYRDWSFPKGKQEPGEDLEETALREVREETGYHCRTKGWIGQVYYCVAGNQLKEVRYWAMEVESGIFRPNNEVDKIRWVKPKKARKLLTWPRDVDILEDFLDCR